MNNETKYTLEKMYPTLIDSDKKSFKSGDIITNGKETKIATQSSSFFNFKNWGYIKKDLVLASVSHINAGQLFIASVVEDKKITGFETNIKVAKTPYAAGISALKIEASTGHASLNIPNINKDFIKLFVEKNGALKITNVPVHKINKENMVLKLHADGTVITKPVFKKFKNFKK